MRGTLGALFILFVLTPVGAFPASAGTGDFAGRWNNIDGNTRGITRVVITGPRSGDTLRIRVFASCSPEDCDWGTEPLRLYGENITDTDYRWATATFDTVSSVVTLTLSLGREGRLVLESFHRMKDDRSNYYSRAEMRRSVSAVRPVPRPTRPAPPARRPVRPPTKPAALGKEDCLSINSASGRVERKGSKWVIVMGRMSVVAFDSQSEARKALAIMKKYGFTQQCFVGRPGPSMEYYLAKRQAPRGVFRGEDCLSLNPSQLEAKRVRGSWKIVEGSNWLMDFGDNAREARRSLQIIQHYGFTRTCFVGRPDPSLTYFRR